MNKRTIYTVEANNQSHTFKNFRVAIDYAWSAILNSDNSSTAKILKQKHGKLLLIATLHNEGNPKRIS